MLKRYKTVSGRCTQVKLEARLSEARPTARVRPGEGDRHLSKMTLTHQALKTTGKTALVNVDGGGAEVHAGHGGPAGNGHAFPGLPERVLEWVQAGKRQKKAPNFGRRLG